MSTNNRYDETEDALRQLVRSGAVELPPTPRVAERLAARAPVGSLPDTVRGRLLRTIRGAGVDRRIAEVRAPTPAGRSFSEHLRSVRADAKLSLEELADRLSVPAQHLRDAERSASALLSWPAPAVAELLQLLDLPLHIATASVRRAEPLFGSPNRVPYRAAASLPEDHTSFPAPIFAETARILRERGRDDLLVAG
jgi:transcriptional regulator with XRE-family HTH domain